MARLDPGICEDDYMLRGGVVNQTPRHGVQRVWEVWPWVAAGVVSAISLVVGDMSRGWKAAALGLVLVCLLGAWVSLRGGGRGGDDA